MATGSISRSSATMAALASNTFAPARQRQPVHGYADGEHEHVPVQTDSSGTFSSFRPSTSP